MATELIGNVVSLLIEISKTPSPPLATVAWLTVTDITQVSSLGYLGRGEGIMVISCHCYHQAAESPPYLK